MKINAKFVVLPLLAFPLSAQATNGYFMHGSSITAQGMAGAGVAMAHDSIHSIVNPATLTQQDERFDLGVDLFIPDRSSEVGGASYDANGKDIFFMPQLGLVKEYNDKITYGVALYGNGGMNTSYTINPFSGMPGNAGVDLAQIFLTGSLGLKLTESTSVGFGVTHMYQRFKAEGIGLFGNAPMNMSSDSTALSDNGYDSGTGWGYKFGFQSQLNGVVTVGATWTSSIDSSKFDKYSGLFAEQGDFDVPSSLAAGLALKLSPETTLALDWERINYSEVKAIANTNTAGGLLGADNGMGFGWEDMDVVKLGVEHDVSDQLTLRAGYSYTDQPIPASQTFFNVLAPAVVEKHLSLGGTYDVSSQTSLTFSYTHAFENTLDGVQANLKMDQDLLGMTWTHQF
jgi:long-chain fatty acid transport protein